MTHPLRAVYLFIFLALLASAGCASKPAPPATVVWISIDGLRGDYVSRANPPTLTRLAAEGASSRRVRPMFPSLTFPNHVAQVTGTTVDHHGVPLNNFIDATTGQKYDFPDDSALLRAEPIWTTA